MFKLLKNLGKKQWGLVFVCLLLIICQVWLDLKMPDYMSAITQLVQTEGSEMSEIIKNGAYMLACAIRKFNSCNMCWLFSFWDFSNIFNERKKKII